MNPTSSGYAEDSSQDLLHPPKSLRDRLAKRIAGQTGAEPACTAAEEWREPEWKDVAPGISCQILAMDAEHDRVSMLVRLAAGTDYPPHRHAGVEEMHLLHGELNFGDFKLYAGDYKRAEPGTADGRVWTETGCVCVLITSLGDIIL